MKRIFKSNHAFLYPSYNHIQERSWTERSIWPCAIMKRRRENPTSRARNTSSSLSECREGCLMIGQHPSPKISSDLRKLTVSALIWNNSYIFVPSELMNFTLLNIYWIYEKKKIQKTLVVLKNYKKTEKMKKTSEFVSSLFISDRTRYVWFRIYRSFCLFTNHLGNVRELFPDANNFP